MARRIFDISEDLYDQLIEKVKLSSIALQEATDVIQDVYLITYIIIIITLFSKMKTYIV